MFITIPMMASLLISLFEFNFVQKSEHDCLHYLFDYVNAPCFGGIIDNRVAWLVKRTCYQNISNYQIIVMLTIVDTKIMEYA